MHADDLPHCMRMTSLIACRLPPSSHADCLPHHMPCTQVVADYEKTLHAECLPHCMPCTQVVADYEKTLRDVISKARKLAATAAAMLLAGAPPQVFRTEFVERRLPSVSHHVDHAPPASTVPLILFNSLIAC